MPVLTENPVKYFGEHWDAPITDGAEQIPTPTTAQCMSCQESFREGDQGVVYPTGYCQHKECGLRSVYGGIGHLIDHARYCHGPLGTDAGLSYRDSAILVWRHFVERQPVTDEELARLRSER